MESGIWVLVEHRDGEVEESSLEVLSEARRLANKANLTVSALILGHDAGFEVNSLGSYGADKVYFVEHSLLEYYTTDGYTTALTELVKTHDPTILLVPATVLGRDIVPRLAIKLETDFVSDCTVLDISDEGILEMTRPILGGRVYATMMCPSARPQIATLRPGVFGTGRPHRGREAEVQVVQTALQPEAIRTRILGYTTVDPEILDISEAENVLAIGRGLGEGSYLSNMEELARILGASLGGSRVAVDEGWVSFKRQIGQTGKTISPKFILCCGISGAPQFTMGMQDSRFIVAINKDRRASIFNIADVSVLGDIHEIIPQLIKRLRGMTGARS